MALSKMEERAQVAMNRLLKKVVLDVIPEEGWGDVSLEAFLSIQDPMGFFLRTVPSVQSMLFFPQSGRIKEYKLNPKQEFFSNAHQDIDPIVVANFREPVFLKQSDPVSHIWAHGGKYVHNVINGVILFKQNPFQNPNSYPGFKEFQDYDQKREKGRVVYKPTPSEVTRKTDYRIL